MCRMGFITGGPNEALVVSGCFHSQPLIVVGGWAFVIPCVQKVQRLNLNIMTLKVASPTVYAQQGVPLSVTGIAQVWYLFWSFAVMLIFALRVGDSNIPLLQSISTSLVMQKSWNLVLLDLL